MIYNILKDAVNFKASDIHLTNKLKPILRINGEIRILEHYPINTPEILFKYSKIILNELNYLKYEKNKSVDSSLEFEGCRYRVHVYRQRECDTFALRLIPSTIPSLEKMNLPLVLKKFTTVKNGLVLITGITGSGKSTTLASLIAEINNNYSKHIITIEDPIEFIHEHNKSIINQREVGVDVISFTDATRAAMREDPDILLLGEMRDLETISNAITIAETGHLVFATLHTKSVAETVDRIIDVFPPNQQEQIRIQLSNSIKGIVSQELIPKNGGGRVACCEVMIATDSIKNLIKQQASASSIIDQIQMNNTKLGSQTIPQALFDLVKRDLITKEGALNHAIGTDREEIIRMLNLWEKKGRQ